MGAAIARVDHANDGINTQQARADKLYEQVPTLQRKQARQEVKNKKNHRGVS